MKKIRLDKFLSTQLNITRSEARKMLKTGCVAVDGIEEKKGDRQIDTAVNTVSVNGRAIEFKSHIYVMLNKPKGVVSATVSPNDVNVVDLLPEELMRSGIFPAGRLDKDTTGFVLLTDDGEFAHDILSPSKHISKTYTVTLERDVSEDEFELFGRGMSLGDIVLKPASLKKISDKSGNPHCYEIVITEGRYHQIKRMFASTGNKVVDLHRTKMGNLCLDCNLKEGEARELSSDEILLIKQKA